MSIATETATFTPRLDAGRAAPKAYKAMSAFDQSVNVDPVLHELIKLRASQLNGCAYCLDMHDRDARGAGEDPRRLATLAGWHESPFFTEDERAALALTDAVTRLGQHGVPDDVADAAAAHFDETELANILWAIIAINAWNRLAITCRSIPGT